MKNQGIPDDEFRGKPVIGICNTWSRITPMGRPGTVEDVANAVLFLVSPKASHITGQNLIVDGGWTAVSVPPY